MIAKQIEFKAELLNKPSSLSEYQLSCSTGSLTASMTSFTTSGRNGMRETRAERIAFAIVFPIWVVSFIWFMFL